MRRLAQTLAIAIVLAAVATPAAAQPNPDSLYKRIGGYDAIAAVVDNFVPRLVKDPMLAKYFVHSQDTLMHIRQLAVDQICALTGGPCVYIGRDMKTSHKGFGISAAEWDLAVKHLTATLDQFKVPAAEKDELLTAVSGLRGDIVENDDRFLTIVLGEGSSRRFKRGFAHAGSLRFSTKVHRRTFVPNLREPKYRTIVEPSGKNLRKEPPGRTYRASSNSLTFVASAVGVNGLLRK